MNSFDHLLKALYWREETASLILGLSLCLDDWPKAEMSKWIDNADCRYDVKCLLWHLLDLEHTVRQLQAKLSELED
jgi:hypothetical protein